MQSQELQNNEKVGSIPRMAIDDGLCSRGVDQSNRSYHQFQADILALAQMADISRAETFPRHSGFLGGIKQWVKLKGNRIVSPLIRLYLFKQIRINKIILNLSMKVAALEARVLELEAQSGASETQSRGGKFD